MLEIVLSILCSFWRKNYLTTTKFSNKINKKTGGKNMLVTTKEMFEKSMKEHFAIGAFNVNNMEIIQGLSLIHI